MQCRIGGVEQAGEVAAAGSACGVLTGPDQPLGPTRPQSFPRLISIIHRHTPSVPQADACKTRRASRAAAPTRSLPTA